jgi:hypothetical protein
MSRPANALMLAFSSLFLATYLQAQDLPVPAYTGEKLKDPIFDAQNLDKSEFVAWKSSIALKNYFYRLYNRYPGRVCVFAHSLGNIPVGEALRLAGNNQVVNTYVSCQAALAADLYDQTSPAALIFQYNHPKLHVGLRNCGPHTPNIYGNWLSPNSSAVAVRINFYNRNDYALAQNSWGFNQIFKPDGAVGNAGYFFRDSLIKVSNPRWYPPGIDDIPPWNHFGKSQNGTDVMLDIVNNLSQRYEVMAFAAEARSSALGATPVGAGMVNVDLTSIWPSDPRGKAYSEHVWHSAQFRMNNMRLNGFWSTLLRTRGFDIQ